MLCFNDDYVIPAGVAVYSMLLNADKNFEYKIHILENGISDEHKELLFKTVEPFKNASLEFISMNNKFENLFRNTYSKAHYSKEMFYKLIVPSVFPQYDKIMIADVDVIYLGDIAKIYNDFDIDKSFYLCGFSGRYHGLRVKSDNKWVKIAYKNFTEEEMKKITVGINAGYMIFNLKKMREDNIENKFLDFVYKNSHRIACPEQDTINLICYPNIENMPLNSHISIQTIENYKDILCEDNSLLSEKELTIKKAILNPIQLHYVGPTNKPWNHCCEKYELWFEYLFKTPMAKPYFENIFKLLNKKKIVLTFKTPIIPRKFTLIKERIS